MPAYYSGTEGCMAAYNMVWFSSWVAIRILYVLLPVNP